MMTQATALSAPSDAIDRANDLQAPRDVTSAMLRGLRCRCPNCGEGHLFASFLKSVDACQACGQEIHHHRADDLPPYLTIFIVGHVVVALFMAAEEMVEWSMWTHLAVWVPVTALMSLVLLQPLKGATIGLQYALKLGGFGGKSEEGE